jgi:TolA-binding protein
VRERSASSRREGTGRRERNASTKKEEPEEPAPPAAPLPPDVDATDLYYSGKTKLANGDARGAIADLSLSLQARRSALTMVLLGQAYFDAGELGKAEKTLRAAGSHPDAMLLLATLYQQRGQTDKARQTWRAFIERHPQHPKADWARRILQTL